MDQKLFASIINKSESPTLDFKREHYKLIGGSDADTAKFVKDFISFTNTVRETPAYIIIGIAEESEKIELIGITSPVDDNILQSKIKDKIYPRPIFSYSNFVYNEKVFGIIEIPIKKYPEPVMPTIKMKGLEIGKVYFRQGSSNIEANGREIIEINNWITNVSDSIQSHKIVEEVTDLTFREVKVLMSPLKVNNVQSYGGYGVEKLGKELKEKENFYEIKIVMNDKIHDIEDTLERYKVKGINSFSTMERNSKNLFNSDKFGDMTIYLYTNFDSHSHLYQAIRKKYTELLMKKI